MGLAVEEEGVRAEARGQVLVKRLIAPREVGPVVSGDVIPFSEGIHLGSAVVEPHGRAAPHSHEASEEAYYVVEGSGYVEVGGERYEVGAGKAVLIPRGAEHWIVNTGEERLRLIYARCHPRRGGLR